jgi:hypothetical protein
MIMKRMISCAEARQLDLVQYLEKWGHQPQKIRGNDYWYLSPLREEKTPSFKLNRKLNIWYDHGIGKGGNLVDLGVFFYGCSVAEFLQKLEGKTELNLSFHPPLSPSQSGLDASENRLIIRAASPITSPTLCRYLRGRNIEPDLAKQQHPVGISK